jgi:NTP pyrophosphatase (non-canonical NTP hydrolase)
MKYKLYHIPGKKIGVTLDPKHRVETQQGYGPGEYEILEESNDIDYISHREIELQKSHGYRVDETLYKQLNPNINTMRINITEQTTTFPVPLNKLKGRLMDNIGMVIQTGFNRHELDTDLVDWIMKHAVTSQFNEDRCYVYNKAMSNFKSSTTRFSGITEENVDKQISHSAMFTKIRRWAYERGIYDHGDSKTQYVKLMEEAGELAEALLKNDKPEIIDAIGDMVVVLTNLAKLEKLDIEDCIDHAYTTISKRTGKMMNGTFVKNTL